MESPQPKWRIQRTVGRVQQQGVGHEQFVVAIDFQSAAIPRKRPTFASRPPSAGEPVDEHQATAARTAGCFAIVRSGPGQNRSTDPAQEPAAPRPQQLARNVCRQGSWLGAAIDLGRRLSAEDASGPQINLDLQVDFVAGHQPATVCAGVNPCRRGMSPWDQQFQGVCGDRPSGRGAARDERQFQEAAAGAMRNRRQSGNRLRFFRHKIVQTPTAQFSQIVWNRDARRSDADERFQSSRSCRLRRRPGRGS